MSMVAMLENYWVELMAEKMEQTLVGLWVKRKADCSVDLKAEQWVVQMVAMTDVK